MLNVQLLEKECHLAASKALLHGTVIAAGTSCSLDFIWAWGDMSVAPCPCPMTCNALFDVASLTKVVATASASVICCDKGLLDPDAPASQYLPELGQFGDSVIRVRDLATHCSGFDNRKFGAKTPEKLLDAVLEAPAQWPAREHFEYSCRNYMILGRIVEAVTEEPLASFCKRSIFYPLDMEKTAFGPLQTNLEQVVPTNAPTGIISDEQARTAGRPVGNAGLFSCAQDLANFCQTILAGGEFRGKQIFSRDAVALLTQPCNPPKLPNWSFGWEMRSFSECLHRPQKLSAAAIGHSGWTGQSIWIDPKLDLFVIVLTDRAQVWKQTGTDNYNLSKLFRSRIADIVISGIRQF